MEKPHKYLRIIEADKEKARKNLLESYNKQFSVFADIFNSMDKAEQLVTLEPSTLYPFFVYGVSVSALAERDNCEEVSVIRQIDFELRDFARFLEITDNEAIDLLHLKRSFWIQRKLLMPKDSGFHDQPAAENFLAETK